MNGIFEGCELLESLPDISNWNTENITDLNRLFFKCCNLKSLPDISKWNINKVTKINDIFMNVNY